MTLVGYFQQDPGADVIYIQNFFSGFYEEASREVVYGFFSYNSNPTEGFSDLGGCYLATFVPAQNKITWKNFQNCPNADLKNSQIQVLDIYEDSNDDIYITYINENNTLIVVSETAQLGSIAIDIIPTQIIISTNFSAGFGTLFASDSRIRGIYSANFYLNGTGLFNIKIIGNLQPSYLQKLNHTLFLTSQGDYSSSTWTVYEVPTLTVVSTLNTPFRANTNGLPPFALLGFGSGPNGLWEGVAGVNATNLILMNSDGKQTVLKGPEFDQVSVKNIGNSLFELTNLEAVIEQWTYQVTSFGSISS